MSALEGILRGIGPCAVAVSGGIDSLTLATAAFAVLGDAVTMHHAVSPAVPGEATVRVRALAARFGWALDVFDAGEFADPAYRANPVNRCFFCKTNLYGAVAGRTDKTILSGTNLDDLGEYRPGLEAARAFGVRHPFVEAEVDKTGVRLLARALGLGALAELPAAPCLSSRIETGIRIEAPVLAMVHAAENLVRNAMAPRAVRCRVRADSVVIELDRESLAALEAREADRLRGAVADLAREVGISKRVDFAPYRNGSAFLRVPA